MLYGKPQVGSRPPGWEPLLKLVFQDVTSLSPSLSPGSGEHEVSVAGRLAAHRRLRQRHRADRGGGGGARTGETTNGNVLARGLLALHTSHLTLA